MLEGQLVSLVVRLKVVVAFFPRLEEGGQKGILYTNLRSSDGGYESWG